MYVCAKLSYNVYTIDAIFIFEGPSITDGQY